MTEEIDNICNDGPMKGHKYGCHVFECDGIGCALPAGYCDCGFKPKNTPYEEGMIARLKGLSIAYCAYDSNARRQDYEDWRRGWILAPFESELPLELEKIDKAFNDSKFLCDECYRPLTAGAVYLLKGDNGLKFVCKGGCGCERCYKLLRVGMGRCEINVNKPGRQLGCWKGVFVCKDDCAAK